MEEVASESKGGIKLFDLRPNLDISIRNNILERLKKIPDYKAIVLDCHYGGKAKFEKNIKNEFVIPEHMTLDTYKRLFKSDKAKDIIANINAHVFRLEEI